MSINYLIIFDEPTNHLKGYRKWRIRMNPFSEPTATNHNVMSVIKLK